MIQVLHKLHKNLGHPSNTDLIRVLRHGQATEEAFALAQELSCSFCESHKRPKTPVQATDDRAVGFNKQIGMDVKYLTGWKPNQKIRALNVVCHGSSFQRVVPFFEKEALSCFVDCWIHLGLFGLVYQKRFC